MPVQNNSIVFFSGHPSMYQLLLILPNPKELNPRVKFAFSRDKTQTQTNGKISRVVTNTQKTVFEDFPNTSELEVYFWVFKYFKC